MSVNYPLISAKRWAISTDKKGVVHHGKNQDIQCEVASMTKVCTLYTCCRILEEMGIYSIQKAKNIYLRVSRKAAFTGGTSAYLCTDYRISLYDCLCALMLPSGNDAAIVLATEFGRWLYLIGDKQKRDLQPLVSTKGKIGNFGNTAQDSTSAIEKSFMYPRKGHEDYIEAFMWEMNK
jgi:D-alanyl-D-alanine carboxypeptidase